MARPTRVLVTGSNGLLGTKLLELLLAAERVEPLGLSRGPCAGRLAGRFLFRQVDLTDRSAVERAFGEACPDVVLHTAAMTDVDGCERDPGRAWRENVDATAHVARACAARGARLVHLSTEYVFDGTGGPYTEDDTPNPQGVYGKSKLASEVLAAGLAPGCAIARTTILYGYAPHARPNFVTWLVGRLRSGEPTRVVTDQVGSPTLADNLAEMVWALAQDPAASGVCNTAGRTVVDRYTFARQVAACFGLDGSLLVPTSTASLAQLAPRPLRAGLRMEQFQARYPGVRVLGAEEGLSVLRAQQEAGAAGWE